MAELREKRVEAYLLRHCRTNGLLCLKFTSPARNAVPDRVVVGPRSTVFVEVKRPGGRARRDQQEMHAKIRRFGGEVYVVDDKTGVDELIAALLAGRPGHQETAS